MRSFLVALQFLTRFNIKEIKGLNAEDFGRSVAFFPAAGAVLGLCYSGAAFLLAAYCPQFHLLTAALLLVLSLYLTGGLFCDGLMDTADGFMARRGREKTLEIMKDSRVGSGGVIAFFSIMLIDFSSIAEIAAANSRVLPLVMFAMPVAGRFATVAAIRFFPYARNEGMGKAFREYSGGTSLLIALLTTAFFLSPLGVWAAVFFFAPLALSMLFCRMASNKLGGLTGDVYGATCMLAETCFLASGVFICGNI